MLRPPVAHIGQAGPKLSPSTTDANVWTTRLASGWLILFWPAATNLPRWHELASQMSSVSPSLAEQENLTEGMV